MKKSMTEFEYIKNDIMLNLNENRVVSGDHLQEQ